MQSIEALLNKIKISVSADRCLQFEAQSTPEVIAGAINKHKKLERNLVIGFLIIFALLSIIVRLADSFCDKSTAYDMAKVFVSNRLVSPSSAKFPSRSANGVIVKHLGRNRYSVAGYLDSKNTFGHEVRSQYHCVIRYVGTEEWICEEIAMR